MLILSTLSDPNNIGVLWQTACELSAAASLISVIKIWAVYKQAFFTEDALICHSRENSGVNN